MLERELGQKHSMSDVNDDHENAVVSLSCHRRESGLDVFGSWTGSVWSCIPRPGLPVPQPTSGKRDETGRRRATYFNVQRNIDVHRIFTAMTTFL